MYRIRSVNPRTAYVRQFDLQEDGPLLIGRIPIEVVIGSIEGLLEKAPKEFRKTLFNDILSAKYTITMGECKIQPRPISRAHCMIFPGHKPQVVDLFSTNGTLLARNGAGVVLIPGQRTDLLPGDILLLSRGSALFHYMGTF